MQGRFKLHAAALKGDVDLVAAVLKEAVDLNELDEHGNSALHWAVMRGDYDIVKALLYAGANPNVISDEGYTPKWSAVDFGLTSTIELLTLYGGVITTNEDFDKVSWSVFKGLLGQDLPGEK
jgi:ankyrin repeat protein